MLKLLFMITPEQCRMARAALEMSVRHLAAMAIVSKTTVVHFEKGEEVRKSTMSKLEKAFQDLNIEFIASTKNSGPGVRLKNSESVTNQRPTHNPA